MPSTSLVLDEPAGHTMDHHDDAPASQPGLPAPSLDDLVEIQPVLEPIGLTPPAPLPPPPVGQSWLELASVLDVDCTAVATLDHDGRLHTANRTFLDLIATDQLERVEDVEPGTPAALAARAFLDHVPNEILRDPSGGVWHGDVDHDRRASERSGARSSRVLRATVSVAPRVPRVDGGAPADATDTASGPISILLHDVTEARRRLAQVQYRATHDPLTDLANRHLILRHLAEAIGQQRHERGHVAAVFVDLDHLKYVNDSFGHGAGDRLLSSTAARLEEAIRPSDHVARIGGDEFLVVSAGIADPATALELGERIRTSISGQLALGDLDVDFSVSVGIALSDEEVLTLGDDDAAATLIANADAAMYAAKQAGRGRCTLYTDDMRRASSRRAVLTARLGQALLDGSLTVEYQPVYSTTSKLAVAAEAFVRWHDDDLGSMDPATFVAVAEESGMIGRLGDHVLQLALDDLAAWRAAGTVDDDFAVHINVSRVQLASTAFVSTVIDMIERRRLSPEQIVLDVRETSLLARVTDVDRSIRSLRRHGVRIAVDDFGTGPKALSIITDVGADILKLDGSFALPSGVTEVDTRLARAVVLLAHTLDMDVVAERVSGLEQLSRLQAAGCDMVQGHFLAVPTPATDIRLDRTHPW
ncbi:MAG: bifunctional diguanylate cyclase/phosphodiesterase [Actinomycetota bacterium]